MSTILLDPAEGKESQVDNSNQGISYADACSIDEHAADSETLNAIKNYTSDSNEMNNYELLRSLGILLKDSETAKQEDNCTALRHYLNTGRLPFNKTLYCGTSLDHFFSALIEQTDSKSFLDDCVSLSDKELNNKYRTKIFTYGKFWSTSVSFDSACDFISYPNPCMLRIYAPKGTACRCVETISELSTEHEVTLPSNTKFQFKRLQTEADGMKTILLTVIIQYNKENDNSTVNGYGDTNC